MNKANYKNQFCEYNKIAKEQKKKAEIALANYIHEVQSKTEEGFVRFTETIGFPCFECETDEHYNENIFGVKAVGNEEDREFLIYTDSNPYSLMHDERNWFDWEGYGRLSMNDIFSAVQAVDETL